MTFSEYAKFYDLLYGTKDYKFEFENILKRIPIVEIDNVLELGCGTGTYSVIAAEYFENISAVDLSRDMIKYWSKETICNVADDFGLSLVESFDLHTGTEVSSESFGITYLFTKKL